MKVWLSHTRTHTHTHSQPTLAIMPPQAPIVIRHGAVLAIRRGSDLYWTASRARRCCCHRRTQRVLRSSRMKAVAEVRRATGSSQSSSLKEIGRDALAKRLRTSARTRGATAHPDGSLAQDIRTACAEARGSTDWCLSDLADDRTAKLRSYGTAYRGSVCFARRSKPRRRAAGVRPTKRVEARTSRR